MKTLLLLPALALFLSSRAVAQCGYYLDTAGKTVSACPQQPVSAGIAQTGRAAPNQQQVEPNAFGWSAPVPPAQQQPPQQQGYVPPKPQGWQQGGGKTMNCYRNAQGQQVCQ